MRAENSTYVHTPFTAVPHELIREHMPNLNGSELKCLLYILDRTLGFNKRRDAISLRQFSEGITRKDGTRLDHGTGLSRSAVKHALASLVKKGLVGRERRWARYGEPAASLYHLRFGDQDQGVGSESVLPRAVRDTTQGTDVSRQETGDQETTSKKQNGAASPRSLGDSGPDHRLNYREKKQVTSTLRKIGVNGASRLVDDYLDRGFTPAEITSLIGNVLANDGVHDPAALIAYRLRGGYPP